jgi:hypothetical protein
MVFSMWFMLRCYKQDKLGVSELEDCCGSVVVSCCCSKLVAEAREQFRNPEERECLLLEADAKQRNEDCETGH